MAVTLVITDNGDGTGTATVAGGAVGTVTLSKAAWTGVSGPLTFGAVGSRSGDGTIALTGAGFFLWQLVDAAGAPLAAVYQAITQATVGVMLQLLNAVQVGIRTLALSGISSVNVMDPQWLPRVLPGVELASLPKVFISPWDRESFPGVLNNKDDVGLCVVVCFVDYLDQKVRQNLDRDTHWRWRTMKFFQFQAPAGISAGYGVYNCVPEPDVIIPSEWWKANLYVGSFGLRFITRSVRGLVA